MFDFGISLSMFFTILMYLDVSHVSVESLCMLSSNGFNGFFFPLFTVRIWKKREMRIHVYIHVRRI